jgi:transporter family-2 protein
MTLALLTLLLGAALAVQAAANVQLSSAMGSPFGGATAQLALGSALLVTLAAVVGTLGALDRLPDVPVWHLVGGFGSTVYILGGILLFPRLGALVTVGLFIAGQMLASLAVDGFGLLGVEREGFTAATIVGAVAVLAGAVLIVRAAWTTAQHVAWLAFALGTGAALALQGPINTQLRRDLDAPVTAGAFSFLVATLAMIGVLLVWQASTRAARPHRPASSMPWWGWAGAFVGATYVTSIPLVIPEIGAATTIGLTVAGQQVASLVVDRYGLLRLPRRPLTPARLSGVALLLAGVALLYA